MKLRLLNASHQGLCYFGYLAGHRYVHDVMADPRFAEFLLAYMEDEGTPSLRPLPGVDLDAYRHQDRKSTRLNSSHVAISYAVFCLKKKTRSSRWLAYSAIIIYPHSSVI